MASKIALSYKLEEAEERLRHESERLRSRGVDIGSRPDRTRQADVNSVNLVVWAGDVLEAANQRLDELLAEGRTLEPSSEHNYRKMRVEELRELLEDRKIEIPDGAKKADLVALLEGADDPAPPETPEPAPVVEPVLLPIEPETPVNPEALGTVVDVPANEGEESSEGDQQP